MGGSLMRSVTHGIRVDFSVDEALAWIARVKPKRAALTHMHVDLDYDLLARALPEGVEPAYDGMVLTTTG